MKHREILGVGLMSDVPRAQLTYSALLEFTKQMDSLSVSYEMKDFKKEEKLFSIEEIALSISYKAPEIDPIPFIIRNSIGSKKTRKCNNSKRPKSRKKK